MDYRKDNEEDRNEELRQVMRQYSLKPKHIAAILGRSIVTVRIWLCKGEKTTRVIPAELLELLKLKLAAESKK